MVCNVSHLTLWRVADWCVAIEPTSALDAATSENVEKQLLEEVRRPGSTLKALVWITHSVEQGKRVGTRFMRVTAGGLHEEEPPRDV